MRLIVCAILTGTILSCPLFCGAGEVGCATHQATAAGEPSHDSSPGDCPEASDNCICDGAIVSVDVRAPGLDVHLAGFPLPALESPGLLDHSPSHWLRHLTSDGHPAGLAGWGDASMVRAWLQDFRC